MACKKCGEALGGAEARKLGVTAEQFAIRKYHAASCPDYRAETHPSGQVPTEHTRRQLAGDARGRAALEHLAAAREALNAACRDLCSVAGAAPRYREIAKLASATWDVEHEMNLDYVRDAHPYKLQHNATDEEIAHGHACALTSIPEGVEPCPM